MRLALGRPRLPIRPYVIGKNQEIHMKIRFPIMVNGLLSTIALASVLGCGASDRTSEEKPSPPLSSSAAALVDPMTYGGGPILQPEIVPIFWGSFTTQQINDGKAYLENLAKYISGV